MSTWNGSPQRELTTNPLSGKLEADHTGQDQIRSPACILSQHEQCAHIHGYGLAPKLRRPRFQAIAQLCTCECHSPCPVTGKHMPLREQTWRESCTCPGAENERAKRDQ